MSTTTTKTRGCQASDPKHCSYHGVPLHKQYIATGDVEQFLKAKEAENREKANIGRISLKDMNANELSEELIKAAQKADSFDESDTLESVELAYILHSHQTRGNRGYFTKTPYIEHPLRNAVRLQRLGCEDQDIITAAVLHDTIEDGAQQYLTKVLGKTTTNELEAREILGTHIKQRYGMKVYEYVQAVTNDYYTDTDKAQMTPQQKNEIYLNHVEKSIRNNPGVLLVKISDFIDNATGLHHNDVQGREEKTLKQASKYLPVVNVFIDELTRTRLPVPEAEQQRLITLMRITAIRLETLISKHQ